MFWPVSLEMAEQSSRESGTGGAEMLGHGVSAVSADSR